MLFTIRQRTFLIAIGAVMLDMITPTKPSMRWPDDVDAGSPRRILIHADVARTEGSDAGSVEGMHWPQVRLPQ